jgi:hypothetical protein
MRPRGRCAHDKFRIRRFPDCAETVETPPLHDAGLPMHAATQIKYAADLRDAFCPYLID